MKFAVLNHHKRMTKKGALTWEQILPAILAVIILAVLLFIFKDQLLGTLYPSLSAEKIRQSRESCQFWIEQHPEGFDDEDEDGYPDNIQRNGLWCDLCLGGSEEDSDDDGVPDECEKRDTVDKPGHIKLDCENWDKKLDRCTT